MAKRGGGSDSHLFGQLKEFWSGAAIRTLAGIRDTGEVFVGVIQDVTGQGSGPNQVHSKFRDVWTHVVDALTGQAVLARLYAPAGILWRMPKQGDGAHVIRGRKMDRPGGPLVMIDGGDGSTDNVVPSWFDDDNSGLYEPKMTLHVEAKEADVKVDATASGKKVLLQGGGKGVARKDDTVNCGWLYFIPNVPPGGAASLAYMPPDTIPVPTPALFPPPGVLIPLRGIIDGASNKTESG